MAVHVQSDTLARTLTKFTILLMLRHVCTGLRLQGLHHDVSLRREELLLAEKHIWNWWVIGPKQILVGLMLEVPSKHIWPLKTWTDPAVQSAIPAARELHHLIFCWPLSSLPDASQGNSVAVHRGIYMNLQVKHWTHFISCRRRGHQLIMHVLYSLKEKGPWTKWLSLGHTHRFASFVGFSSFFRVFINTDSGQLLLLMGGMVQNACIYPNNCTWNRVQISRMDW